MKKVLRYFAIAGATIALGLPTVATLASCSNNKTQNFIMATSNDLFANSVTQLGASFVDAPSTTEFKSVYGSLLTYVNEGDYEYSGGELSNQPIARLVFEAATKIVVYGTKNGSTTEEVLLTIDSSNLNNNDAFIVENGSYSINLTKFGEAIVNATKVEFTLNKDFKWVDSQGQPRQDLVPRDFLYSLKGYKNSSTYSLNNNGYFLELSGIDYEKTIKHSANDSIKAGDTFTYFIGSTKTPYLLDILTKQYFFPIPYSHPDTQATLETPDNAKVLKFTDSTSGQKIIDKPATDWSKVYGGAQEKGIDVWSIGPYYLSSKSQQDVVFSINQSYFDAMKSTYDMNKLDINKKIPKIIKMYKAGDQVAIYNRFGTGEVSYAPVPQEQNTDAIKKYINSNSLKTIPAPKSSQGRFVGYNLSIYNDEGQIKNSELIGTQYVNFVQKFHTENSLKIRKGLNEYINWAHLAEVRYGTGTKDFSLSSIPYGVFPVKTDSNSAPIDYYQAIGHNQSLEIENNSSTGNNGKLEPKGIINGTYNQMMTNDKELIATEQQKTEFQSLLTTEGYTKTNPLKLPYWTLSQANNNSEKTYFESVASAINNLSGGAIEFTYKSYDASSTITNVYYNKSVPMADMLWGPDYNGVGTWVGIYFAYEYNADGTPKDLTDKINNSGNNANQDTLKQAYHITNLWKPLYEAMKKETSTSGSTTWLTSLKTHLENKQAATFNTNDTYKSIKSNLDTEISIWAGINQSNGINLVNWIDNQAPILPIFQPSLTYIGYKLVDPKYTIILNLNGDVNYRDFVLNY